MSKPAADGGEYPSVRRVRRVSHWLDNGIPLPRGHRMGIDPIIGVAPVAGDVATTILSVYIITEAIKAGVPKVTVVRMVKNVLIDTVFGSIPVVGDLFDAVWKPNEMNVALLEERVEDPSGGKIDLWVIVATGVGLVVLVLGVTLAIVAAALWLLGQIPIPFI